jgi:protocatechuate 3,4-dioxygenase beta subunit
MAGSVAGPEGGVSVGGIEVILEPAHGPADESTSVRVVTDAEGSFRFEGLEPGSYRLRIDHPGFAHVARDRVGVTARGGMAGIDLVLVSDRSLWGAIEGTVTGPDGLPRVGCEVIVHADKPGVFVRTATDEHGFYRVDRLRAGFYRVSFPPDEGGPPFDPLGLWERFILVSVRPRQTTVADFGGLGALTGVVLDAAGEPVARMVVELTPLDRSAGRVVKRGDTGEDGRFRIEEAGIGPQAVWIRSRTEHWSARAETLTLTGNDQETRIILASTAVEGTIRLAEEDVPPAGRNVHPALLLAPPDPDHPEMAGAYVALTRPERDGSFLFRAVPPGDYFLLARVKGYETDRRKVRVEGGEATTGLEAILRKLRVGTLVVTVRDAEGRPADGVHLVYGNPEAGYRTVRAARPEPGVYVDEKVEAGTWTLLTRREDLKRARATVTVREGETTEVTLTVEPK